MQTTKPPRPHLLLELALLAVLITTQPACKKLIQKLTGTSDEGGAGGDDAPSAKGKKSAAPGSGCDLPAVTLTADFTVKSGCSVNIERDLAIDKDAVLTIEPGARLLFKSGTKISVRHGGIVAKGTAEEPIVFTSANKTPAKGDWEGIFLEADVSAGTTFDHVVIEYAGKTGGYNKGAITFYGPSPAGRVTITNSILRNNAQRAIENRRDKALFAKFENNRLTGNDGTSLLLHPEVVGSIGQNELGDPIRVAAGNMTASATWPKTTLPYFIEGELSVRGVGAPAVLTLPEGATLKFAPGGRLDVGEGAGGGLVARKVTFTSGDPSPAPGSWIGMLVYAKATSTTIDECVFEYAGKSGNYGRGALTFWSTKATDVAGFHVKNTVFRKNKGSAIYSRGGCGELDQPASGNRTQDAPLCAVK